MACTCVQSSIAYAIQRFIKLSFQNTRKTRVLFVLLIVTNRQISENNYSPDGIVIWPQTDGNQMLSPFASLECNDANVLETGR